MSMGTQNIPTAAEINQTPVNAGAALKVSSASKRLPPKHNVSELSAREIRSEKGKQMCRALQDSFEKEISRVKKSPEYNDTSSLFSNNTENDSTVKFISILDKINENQMKKNKFYSEIVKDMSPLLHSTTGDTNYATNRLDFDEAFRTLQLNNRAGEEHPSAEVSQDEQPIETQLAKMVLHRSKRPSQHIDHILELHQPEQNEIIFECSKEWTVNQTPDMREKDMIPAHLAAHLDKMRQETRESRQDTHDEHFGSKKKYVINEEQSRRSKVDQLIASLDGQGSHGASGKIYRLSCQKDLFGSSQEIP